MSRDQVTGAIYLEVVTAPVFAFLQKLSAFAKLRRTHFLSYHHDLQSACALHRQQPPANCIYRHRDHIYRGILLHAATGRGAEI